MRFNIYAILLAAVVLYPIDAKASTVAMPVMLPDTLKKAAPTILRPQDVLKAAQQHSPKILAAQEFASVADGAITEALGAFDASVEQDISSRISGFYDGKQIDTKLVKPFAPLNSTLYTGYSRSDGSFPIYEDKKITTEDGEWVIGAKLSLLRNRDIDRRHLDVLNATLEQDSVEADIAKTVLDVEEDALIYYWEWVAAGLSYNVYQELLGVAKERQQASKTRFENGDLARIYLTENQQYIVQRQVDVTNARRKFEQAANTLSLYYRDEAGQPIIPSIAQLPRTITHLAPEDSVIDSTDAWLQKRPELVMLEAEARQLENTLLLNENSRLPKADLSLEHANDHGSGLESRDEAETIVKLNISFPLQQRKADGAIAQTKPKSKQLEHKRTQRTDALRTQKDNLIVTLNTAREYAALANQEITLAKKNASRRATTHQQWR